MPGRRGNQSGKREQTQRRTRTSGHSASAVEKFLDTEEVAKRVRRNLGLRYEVERDQAGNVISKDEVLDDHAILNKRGINAIMAKFRDVVDKNQSLSQYNAKEIKQLMMDFHEDLARELVQNWEEYGIDNRSQADTIMTMVTNPVYSIYKRAQGGKTLEILGEVPQDITKTTDEIKDDGGRSILPF